MRVTVLAARASAPAGANVAFLERYGTITTGWRGGLGLSAYGFGYTDPGDAAHAATPKSACSAE